MAIIKCPECGKEMSSMANECPNCGYKYKREQCKKLIKGYLIPVTKFVLVILAIVFSSVYVVRCKEENERAEKFGLLLEYQVRYDRDKYAISPYMRAKMNENATDEELDRALDESIAMLRDKHRKDSIHQKIEFAESLHDIDWQIELWKEYYNE